MTHRFTVELRRLERDSHDTCSLCGRPFKAADVAHSGYAADGKPLFVGSCCEDTFLSEPNRSPPPAAPSAPPATARPETTLTALSCYGQSKMTSQLARPNYRSNGRAGSGVPQLLSVAARRSTIPIRSCRLGQVPASRRIRCTRHRDRPDSSADESLGHALHGTAWLSRTRRVCMAGYQDRGITTASKPTRNRAMRAVDAGRVCRAWHVTMSVEVRQPGFRRAEG